MTGKKKKGELGEDSADGERTPSSSNADLLAGTDGGAEEKEDAASALPPPSLSTPSATAKAKKGTKRGSFMPSMMSPPKDVIAASTAAISASSASSGSSSSKSAEPAADDAPDGSGAVATEAASSTPSTTTPTSSASASTAPTSTAPAEPATKKKSMMPFGSIGSRSVAKAAGDSSGADKEKNGGSKGSSEPMSDAARHEKIGAAIGWASRALGRFGP